jgi:hemerythrin
MEEIYWTKDLETGVKNIDYQHKKIFNYINLLKIADKDPVERLSKIQIIMTGLLDYTEIHFEEEELIMQKLKYPDFERHHNRHLVFTKHINELKLKFDRGEEFLPDLLSFIKDWFILHIKEEDMKALKWK